MFDTKRGPKPVDENSPEDKLYSEIGRLKYEDVYLKGYAIMAELTVGLAQYFVFYNAERPHQALGYETPNHVHRTGLGGGALVVDKSGDANQEREQDGSTGRRTELGRGILFGQGW